MDNLYLKESDCTLVVTHYNDKPRTEKQFNNLYVKNFDKTLNESDLEALFIKFGDITSAVIMKDETNQSKGFGFVCFKNPESAKNALSLHGVDNLYVCEAKSKE
jgi:polyadenylate-binding protein